MMEPGPGQNGTCQLTVDEAQKVLDGTAFAPWWGLRVVDLDVGSATLRLPWQPHFLRPGNVLQGGCCMVLADVATWIAAMTRYEDGAAAVTLEMKTNFLGAATTDLTCRGRIVKGGRRIVFCEAVTTDEAGKQVAHHTVTYIRP